MAEPDGEPNSRFDILPIALLVVVVLVLLAGWLLFPAIQHFVSNQDCVASGHTNC